MRPGAILTTALVQFDDEGVDGVGQRAGGLVGRPRTGCAD